MNFKSTTSFKALLVAVPLAISAVGFSGESAKATNLFQDSVIGGFGPPLSSPVTVENSGKPATGAFNTILDDFTLRYDSMVTDLHWWGTNIADPTKFSLSYSTALGAPAIPITRIGTVTKTLTSLTTANNAPIYYYSTNVTPFALAKYKTYYLSIVNANFSSTNTGWDWAYSDPNSGTHWMGQGPTLEQGTLAFDITGYATTPEPSSIVGLAALGILGGASVLKRKFDKSGKEK